MNNLDIYCLDIFDEDYDKIKNHPLLSPIGHFTDQKEICSMKTALGQSIPLEALGWKNFNKDKSP